MVVLPVGRKANWSQTSIGSRAGRSYRLTSFSVRRHKIGVTEIGRKSLSVLGWGTFGIGVTSDASH